eukprot:1205328-Amphidinium_carterae.1
MGRGIGPTPSPSEERPVPGNLRKGPNHFPISNSPLPHSQQHRDPQWGLHSPSALSNAADLRKAACTNGTTSTRTKIFHVLIRHSSNFSAIQADVEKGLDYPGLHMRWKS